MTARRKPRRIAGAEDIGPEHRHRTGELEVVEAPDIDRPRLSGAKVRRAQVRDPVRSMVAQGKPYRLLLAAEAFRRDLARAEGGGVPSQLRPRITVDGARGDGSEGERASALAAQARVRKAWQAIGLALSGVVSWCVVPKSAAEGRTYGTLDGYATCKCIRRQQASEWLEAALHRLADHYSLGNPDTPKDFA